MGKVETFRYVDLFAGIGGFAAALEAFGGKHVYSVEIDKAAAKVYELNWKRSPLGDITEDANDEGVKVKPHDVLVAGFPCQPFSKSGAQRGMDETRGTLFWNIMKIIQAHHPTLVILENVRNLAGPRHTHEMEIIIRELRREGYRVSDQPAIFSPHLLPPQSGGRPQIRERVFITATYSPGKTLEPDLIEPVIRPKPVMGWNPARWNLAADLPLDTNLKPAGTALTAMEKHWIDAWDDWVKLYIKLNKGKQPPGFPIWVDEWVELDKLSVPAGTPKWKANFLVKNAEMYTSHKRHFDAWVKKWKVTSDIFPPSRRKLEWQAQGSQTLWECVMHFRPSGIRAKRATYLPALVAITQTSIIGELRRRLSPREAARLQGLPDNFNFGDQKDSATYKQLGNGVNVGVVWNILKWHVERDADVLKRTAVGKVLLEKIGGAGDNPDAILSKLLG
jgi:DNA (cytosine-5)-methyltransferase 1